MKTKIFDKIFRFIDGADGINWFSSKFYMWKHRRIEEMNSKYKINNTDFEGWKYFKVVGAGYVRLSNGVNSFTGATAGFSITTDIMGVRGMPLFCTGGGVMGMTEARRMAEFIIKECDKIKVTELEFYQEWHQKTFGK